MALFGKSKEGGLLDVIRCDEDDYLVWKWSPSGDANTTKKENAIRYGSSLRVKDGEVAVFVYNQQNGPSQDFIEGPYDDTIKTANFPILSNIVGLAFGGGSPSKQRSTSSTWQVTVEASLWYPAIQCCGSA